MSNKKDSLKAVCAELLISLQTRINEIEDSPELDELARSLIIANSEALTVAQDQNEACYTGAWVAQEMLHYRVCRLTGEWPEGAFLKAITKTGEVVLVSCESVARHGEDAAFRLTTFRPATEIDAWAQSCYQEDGSRWLSDSY